MSEQELKPCPFCGGAGKPRSARAGEDLVDTWVECVDCFARTDMVEGAYAKTATAAWFWNRRADDD